MKKYLVSVNVDLSVLAALQFEVEASDEDEALGEAEGMAFDKLRDMTNHEKLDLIRQVVENDGTIHLSDLADSEVICEESDDDSTANA